MNDAEREQREKSEIKLSRSEEKFRMLFEHSPIGMAMVEHSTGKFLEVNKSLLNSAGYSKEEFLALNYWQLTPKEYDEQEARQIEELNQTGQFGPNYKEYIRKDGSRYPIRINGFLLTNVDGEKVVWGVLEDLTEQRKAEAEIKRLAFYDSLTNLPNRRLLEERLQQAFARCNRETRRGALIFIDLDKFKRLNDNHGHGAGDALLVEVGQRLEAVLRATDTVARFGGDEFVVVLAELASDYSEAAAVAERIAANIQKILSVPYELVFGGAQDALTYRCSASLGIIMFDGDCKDLDQLLDQADKAMYAAKKSASGHQLSS